MAKGKKGKKKHTPKEMDQTRREVIGVCMIALGLFLGASLYSDAVGLLGNAISGFFFGMFGLFGYAVPAAIAASGVLTIIFSEREIRPATFFLVLLGLFSLLSVIHIAARSSIQGVKALAYYKDAYDFGTAYRGGGGILGALLAYPALLLMGTVGSYITFIACILISFLVITKLSLKRAGEKLGEGIKNGVVTVSERMSERKQALYTEDLSNPAPRLQKVTKKSLKQQKIQANPRPAKRAELYTMEPCATAGEAQPNIRPKYEEDALDFFPTEGPLKKRSTRDAELDKAFEEPAEEPYPKGEYFVTDDLDDLDAMANSRISRNAPDKPAAPLMQAAVSYRSTATGEQAANKSESVELLEDVPSTAAPINEYQRPPYSLLNSPAEKAAVGNESPQEKAKLLIDTLANFNISARIINISVGPVITRFELQPAQGVRVNRITALSQDIALALAAPRVRIEAPIPGKAAIGIEIPNKNAATVLLREVIESKEFAVERSPIAFALGKDIAGKIVCANLEKMPHLLIAGATGSGKSVCMNDIILSMVFKSSPAELRLVLIDPKVVEMRMYAPLPHLMLPVVTDPKKAAGALKWAVMEMEQRYQKMAKLNARDLARYNTLVEEEKEKLPKLVVVIDELADLMMVAAKDVEDSICRIAQLGRAAGVHLLVATQRPSTDVITGLIKANIPSRIAFAVSSGIDSRVILDETGAEKLLGKGDMLFHANGASKPIRAQAAFVSDEEVERVMEFFAQNSAEPPLEEEAFERITSAVNTGTGGQGNGKQEDELLPDAVRIVLDSGQASISMIQRRLRVGYARAARLIDIMEQQKIVSGFDGSKPRRLLIDRAGFERMFGQSAGEPEEEEDTDE